MKPLCHNEIYGCWATLLLPLHKDDSINYRLLEKEIDLYVQSNVNGIYSNGTACEFYTQTEEEYIKINDMLAQKCESAKMPFQVGAGHMSPQISLERIKKAVKWKPSAIQVILSDWSPMATDEAVACLQKMEVAADGIGLILYNPPHAKTVLSPEQIAFIKDKVPALQGVKVLDGDDTWYKKVNSLLPDISVFVPGHRLASGYSKGAKGSYSNIACLNPKAASLWYNLMTKDIHKALEIEKHILTFMTECILPYIKLGYQGQACDKFMAAVGGFIDIDPKLRWPYKSIPTSEIQTVREKSQLLLKDFLSLKD